MEWYPTPSYLVKRKVILDYLKTIKVKSFLEVGCGTGDLLYALEQRGYAGVGIDLSAAALSVARERLRTSLISVEQNDISEVNGLFDVVIASEVLEHIQDDVAFLKQLRERVADNGYLFLTVPAHMAKWGANDDFCGHVRRYEQDELRKKIVAADLEIVLIHSYGVPIYNMMKPLYDWAIERKGRQGGGMDERTRNSGGMWVLTGLRRLFYLFFNDVTMIPFYLLQRMFYSSDLGNGFFIVARKPKANG